MSNDDERLLQAMLCGEVSEHDPPVAARLAADPRMRERLRALREAERTLTDLAACPPDLVDEAEQLVDPTDRARVAAALLPSAPIPKSAAQQALRRSTRLRWFAVIGLAAAVILVAIVGGDRRPAPDGRLGDTFGATLQQHEGHWTLAIGDALPPGTSYHLRLELADGTSSTATGDSRTWQFPDAWNAAVGRARTGKLSVEWDDGTGLVVRHTLSMP